MGALRAYVNAMAAARSPSDVPRVLATVTNVWSGDSIEVEIDGRSYEVRYIGIDAGAMPMDANRQLAEESLAGQEVIREPFLVPA